MTENNNDLRDLQQIIEQLYPNLNDIPVNTVASSISGEGDDLSVNFLITVDDKLIQPFISESSDTAKFKTVTSIEKGRGKINYDLYIEFTFMFNSSKMVFQVKFDADNPEIQKRYLEALKKVESFKFFIADKDKKIQKALEMEWYYYKNKKVLTKFGKVNFGYKQ